ncbi:MAG: DUF4435 domain-containing protein [Candidatus Marithrix sp.]
MEEILDSDYWEAFGTIINTDITAYVEGIDDENFWRDMFRKYAPSLQILFSQYSKKGTLENGKKSVLSNVNLENAGKNLILCVDSDYDYLVGNQKLLNPFVFHTYTHSIENYKLSPQGLISIIQKASKPYDEIKILPFDIFLAEYSKCIYPLFLYILYFEKKKLNNIESRVGTEKIETEPLLTNDNLNKKLGLQSSQLETISNSYKSCIEFIKNNVSSLVTELNRKYPEIKINDIEQNLKLKNISESEIFWYIRGHLLYNSVITIIMQKLIKTYCKDTRDWYKNNNETKLKEYNNKVKNIDWKTLLYNNHLECIAFNCCPTLKYIESDITKYTHDYDSLK